jgi:hypothetical protein
VSYRAGRAHRPCTPVVRGFLLARALDSAGLKDEDIAANPTGTVGALAHWQADGIINRSPKHPDTLIT